MERLGGGAALHGVTVIGYLNAYIPCLLQLNYVTRIISVEMLRVRYQYYASDLSITPRLPPTLGITRQRLPEGATNPQIVSYHHQ